MGIPDHLTCLLRNLYVDQEATVRTKHGTTDWFKTGKGVCQGCLLLLCLCYFYAEGKKVKVKSLSFVQLFVTLWTVARQAPSLSLGFSMQVDWSGLTFSPLGDLPNPGIELRSPTLQADSLPSAPSGNLCRSASCKMTGWINHKLESALWRNVKNLRYRWYHFTTLAKRKEEPLDESERGEWKS